MIAQKKSGIAGEKDYDDIDGNIGDKGIKSAANAELLTFYQSLIPQGSKEKDGTLGGFNLRSKSMVTNFMDIPDAQPSNEDKEEGVPANRTSSVAYSNVGTFQTPDRGHSGSLSPNRFMKDVIMENVLNQTFVCEYESLKMILLDTYTLYYYTYLYFPPKK